MTSCNPPMNENNKKAFFLDRDGVLNLEDGYVRSWEEFSWLPEVVEALQLIKKNGYLIIVITNQSGIAKGLYTEDDVQEIHQKMNEFLLSHQVQIDDFYFCPHHPQGELQKYSFLCKCRKPLPGMISQAVEDHHIDFASSYLIGDSDRDIRAGQALGLKTVRVQSGHPWLEGDVQPTFIAKNLLNAVKIVLGLSDAAGG